MFDNIVIWSKLTLRQRYNFLIGIIIVILGYVIVRQEQRCSEMRTIYRTEKIELQNKIDDLKANHLEYLQKLDSEYRELLKEYINIKTEL